jgi:hypothetical protein
MPRTALTLTWHREVLSLAWPEIVRRFIEIDGRKHTRTLPESKTPVRWVHGSTGPNPYIRASVITNQIVGSITKSLKRLSNGLTETNCLRPLHPIAESPRSAPTYT